MTARKRKNDNAELIGVFQELYRTLNRAYWVATTIENKDRIHGLAEAAFDIITELNRADISARSEAFQELRETVTMVNAKLEQLRAEIDQVIHSVKVATEMARKIDQVLPLIGMFLV